MNQAVIESGRAEFALNTVKRVRDDLQIEDKTRKEYKQYCKKFPSLILTNGLAASVAFAMDKGGAYGLIYDNIAEWLKQNGFFEESQKLEGYICSLNSDMYRFVTKETLAMFIWLKRFASGLIKEE